MKYLFPFLFCFSINTIAFAQKYDYQWVFGYQNDIPNGFGLSILDFNNNVVTVDVFGGLDQFELGSGGSFICDKDGEIALLTSNCDIIDKNLNVIEGGNDIYPEEIDFNDHCAIVGGYPLPQSTLFLPELTNDSTYYLVQKNGEVVGNQIVSTETVLNTIVQQTNSSFYVKNRALLNDFHTRVAALTACKNSEGDKWWLFAMERNSNKFYKYLIGNNSIDTITQNIGTVVIDSELIPLQHIFSPSEELFVFTTEIGLFIYDFDNETGELSNFRIIETPDEGNAAGLAFSPDSRFLYLSTYINLYQIDLEEIDTSQAITFLGNVSTTDQYGWPVDAGLMFNGPDCRIYVSPFTGSSIIHVIHNPNEKGLDCDLEINAIQTPTRLEFNLPNLPMYRTNGDCDDEIAWGIMTSTEEVADDRNRFIQISPNPVSDYLNIEFSNIEDNKRIEIYDNYGRLVDRLEIEKGQINLQYDVSRLSNGLHIIIPNNNGGQGLKFMVSR